MHKDIPATILANGRSRLEFDLDQINAKTVTFGCNAIMRDFMTDYLVVIDQPMVFEMIDTKAYLKSKCYAQSQRQLDRKFNENPELTKHIRIIPEHVKQNDSGNTAIALAIEQNFKKIYLVGFDYVVMPNEPMKYNNVYRSTANYAPEPAIGINRTNQKQWQSRLFALVRKNPDIEFIRVNGNDHSLIKMRERKTNLTEILPEQFKKEINKL